MRVHHLNCGTLCPIAERLVSGRGSLFRRTTLVCHCLLVETPRDGLVLVDTGLGAADVADVRGRLGHLFANLGNPVCDPAEAAIRHVERLGFQRSDVRHVVLTHLDLDHAGGIPDFPEAAVHVSRVERDDAVAPATWLARHRYKAVHWAHQPRWQVHEVDGEGWMGFEAVRAVGDDVVLVPLAGHTRGHCGVAVRETHGWLLHAGDAYFHSAEMAGSPSCPPALDAFQRILAMDERRRVHNQQRLRELIRGRGDVRVHCAHDPHELERFVGPLIPSAPESGSMPSTRAPVSSTGG
jgi:glyoxylase-like metal-dependent hydrolase (beta-lactamase superfamily II)